MISKYYKRQIETFAYPKLLINEDKYSKEYWLVDNQTSLFAACLGVVKIRLKTGYIQNPGKFTGKLDSALTDLEYEALPEPYKSKEKAKRASFTRDKTEHEESVCLYKAAKTCIAELDGETAYAILKDRCDYEYEKIEFVDVNL